MWFFCSPITKASSGLFTISALIATGLTLISVAATSPVIGSPDDFFDIKEEYSQSRLFHNRRCDNILERREWRSLSNLEKSKYIDAVLCLQSRPAKDPNDVVSRNRFDEFQRLHISLADEVHQVGQFLPWHRYLLIIHEKALREECGYEGAIPYWNWSIDADSHEPDSFTNAAVFDPDTGFGGDGVPNTYTVPDDPTGTSRIVPNTFRGCVSNGPFANLRLIYGPGKLVGDHCLTRGFDNDMMQFFNSTTVANTLAQPNFELFWMNAEGRTLTPNRRMHDGAHLAVGGEMGNHYSSPGDPLFYLHHANVDRIWLRWQRSQPGRLWEVTGRSTTAPPYVNITLDFQLNMGTMGHTIPIRDIMDVGASPGCYNYV